MKRATGRKPSYPTLAQASALLAALALSGCGASAPYDLQEPDPPVEQADAASTVHSVARPPQAGPDAGQPGPDASQPQPSDQMMGGMAFEELPYDAGR